MYKTSLNVLNHPYYITFNTNEIHNDNLDEILALKIKIPDAEIIAYREISRNNTTGDVLCAINLNEDNIIVKNNAEFLEKIVTARYICIQDILSKNNFETLSAENDMAYHLLAKNGFDKNLVYIHEMNEYGDGFTIDIIDNPYDQNTSFVRMVANIHNNFAIFLDTETHSSIAMQWASPPFYLKTSSDIKRFESYKDARDYFGETKSNETVTITDNNDNIIYLYD